MYVLLKYKKNPYTVKKYEWWSLKDIYVFSVFITNYFYAPKIHYIMFPINHGIFMAYNIKICFERIVQV